MKTSAINNEKATGDNVNRIHPTHMKAGRGAGKLLAGVLGIAGILVAGITAMAAASKAPALPLQVPSSVSTPTPEGNPYGLALVPPGFPKGGIVQPGDLLVSNFNNSAGQQGLGTTIDFIDMDNSDTRHFFRVSGPQTTGFTNALGVAKKVSSLRAPCLRPMARMAPRHRAICISSIKMVTWCRRSPQKPT
jgi:hypothetical protein